MDGNALDVVRKDRIDFTLWGRLHRRVGVRILRKLPSRLLIRRKSALALSVRLNFDSRWFSYTADTPVAPASTHFRFRAHYIS